MSVTVISGPRWLPSIPVRDMQIVENIGNGVAKCREVFGVVVGSPRSTHEVVKVRMPCNKRILGIGDTIPIRDSVHDARSE